MDGSARPVLAAAPLVGDCVLTLQHSVSYEPPMYLFPELLPKVPEGTPEMSVSDALADAIDVDASMLNIAELFRLPCGTASGAPRSGAGENGETEAVAQPKVSLASLLATNRLQAAGLTAEMLQKGKFSSGAIINELLRLKERAGLTDNEAQVVMSNHFINVLAWHTLVEVNSIESFDDVVSPTDDWRASRVRTRSEAFGNNNNNNNSNRDADGQGDNENEEEHALFEGERRVAKARVEVSELQPSVDPWSSDADLQPGVFVAAGESNVEKRIELLDTLTALYRRPWRTLQSRGAQTDRITPGIINVTAPYADPSRLPGAMLDAEKDLKWCPAQEQRQPSECRWVVRVSSSSTGAAPLEIAVTSRFMHFGCTAGVTGSTNGCVTNIHVGLADFTAHPEFISAHHFSLAVLPANTETGGRDGNDHCGTGVNGEKEEGEDDEKSEVIECGPCLWLMNYGRNGTRVVGKQWSLGGMVQLDFGDVLEPASDIRIVVGSSSLIKAEALSEGGEGSVVPIVKLETDSVLED